MNFRETLAPTAAKACTSANRRADILTFYDFLSSCRKCAGCVEMQIFFLGRECRSLNSRVTERSGRDVVRVEMECRESVESLRDNKLVTASRNGSDRAFRPNRMKYHPCLSY